MLLFGITGVFAVVVADMYGDDVVVAVHAVVVVVVVVYEVEVWEFVVWCGVGCY